MYRPPLAPLAHMRGGGHICCGSYIALPRRESMSADDLSPLSLTAFFVLLSLRGRVMHGYAIKKDVAARSDGRVDLDAGGLYRLIARLEARRMVRVAAAPRNAPDDDRKRVFYTLT